MSRETATAETSEESSATSVLDLWRKRYDVVGLAGIVLFMLWVRAQDYGNLIKNGQILFSGNDAYYHFREISYVANNWPWTMPFDPWTGFPYGTSQGQFGTLYDQLVGTIAVIIGLGNPTQQQIAMVTALAPAVLGALVAIPVYYIGRRLRGRGTGLFAALLLAVMPGAFLRRSTVGFADHQVAEVLFISIAILAFMAALAVAESELPIYEQVLDRDWEGLKRPVMYSAAAGFAFSLYLWVWPPGVFLVGMLGIFFTIALSADFLRGRSPDHVASVGVVSMAVVTVFMAVILQTTSFSSTRASLLHIFIAIGVLVWCVLLAGLARLWERRSLSKSLYPAAVLGLIAGGVLFSMVFLPSLFNEIFSNIERAFLFGQSDATLTIAEAKPTPGASLSDINVGLLQKFLFRQYGFVYVLSLVGVVWLTVYTYFTEYRSEFVLLIVWTAMTWLMALSQVRFHYYLVLPIVLVTAWAFGRAASMAGLGDAGSSLAEIETYQVLTILVVLLLVFAPLLPPVAASSIRESQQSDWPMSVIDAGKTGPSGTDWAESAGWMQSNTPEIGMKYYGTYEKTNDFEYPPSAYGVMAWWDYGHWITTLAKRPPHANPFQQNARSASSFFQASSERRANLILDAIPSIQNSLGEIDEMTNAQLQNVVANQSEQHAKENIRYVMIDDQTASGKFTAVRRWANPPGSTYFTRTQIQIPVRGSPQNQTVTVVNDRFKKTMMYKLYYRDANGLSHYRLVQENDQYSIVGGVIRNGRIRPLSSFRPSIPTFQGWSESLRNFSRRFQRANLRNQAVPLGGGTYVYNAHVESSVKVFERVPGATITGQLTNKTNTSVVVRLQLKTGPGRPFVYTQQTRVDDDGNFNLTVPYATNDVVGPADGGTDTNVTATGNYSVYTGIPKRFIGIAARQGNKYVTTQFEVSEQQIYDGATIDLGEVTAPDLRNNQSQGNQSGGNQSEGSTTGNGQSGGGSDGNASDGGNGHLTPSVQWASPASRAARGH